MKVVWSELRQDGEHDSGPGASARRGESHPRSGRAPLVVFTEPTGLVAAASVDMEEVQPP
ncbi:hypothetical protein JOD67_005218 [Tenggerimyces flavus]|nr:hypothetical protein [Tenggerimyces flavus]